MTTAAPCADADAAPLRATRAVIDLDAIAGNLRALLALLPDGAEMMAVVKGNGYGHGASPVARTALDVGATLLGVATVSEGQALRSHGITAPIVILGSIDPSEVRLALESRLEVSLGDQRLLRAVQEAARSSVTRDGAVVHLKIDTGLRRYGALPDEAVALARAIAPDPYVRLGSVFTHFASADEPGDTFTALQRDRFAAAIAAMRAAGLPPVRRHMANSAGILAGWSGDCEIARAGIALYGVPPADEMPLQAGMRPAFRLESRIARLVPIAPGESVGYNRAYRAERPIQGALIPIGYGDGYRRSLTGKAWVGIGGQPAPLIGRVSMDQIVAAVPDGVIAHVGDRVHLVADDPALGAPSIRELAAMMDTNCYELLVGFRSRIPRVYLRQGVVVDADNAQR